MVLGIIVPIAPVFMELYRLKQKNDADFEEVSGYIVFLWGSWGIFTVCIQLSNLKQKEGG
jgi:hypothetical protein